MKRSVSQKSYIRTLKISSPHFYALSARVVQVSLVICERQRFINIGSNHDFDIIGQTIFEIIKLMSQQDGILSIVHAIVHI